MFQTKIPTQTNILSSESHKKTGLVPFFQPKLTVNTPGDAHEQEADRVADQVMRMKEDEEPIVQRMPLTPVNSVQRMCADCEEKQEAGVQRKEATANHGAGSSAPSIVSQVLSSGGGQAMDAGTRQFMEGRFGQDFSSVRIHTGSKAAESAGVIQARAYTSGNDVVFGAGEYQPSSKGGQQLLAHELVHVIQQSDASSKRIQREPKVKESRTETQAEYEEYVKQGKWCRDTKVTGKLHPSDQQCYREMPGEKGYGYGNQFCFYKETGKFAESSPDYVSPVEGQTKDGFCQIQVVPNPLSHGGRRALGHLIADICDPRDSDMCSGIYGATAGVIAGVGLAEHDLKSPGVGTFILPIGMAAISYWAFKYGMPRINRFALRHGFLPNYNFGSGTSFSNFRFSAGMGFEQRDKPLFPLDITAGHGLLPLNTYLTFGLDSTIGFKEQNGSRSSIIAKMGLRIDPFEQGGLYALGSVGAGVSIGKDKISPITAFEVGSGWRLTDFMDIQLMGVKTQGDRDLTFMLKLNLVAPQKVLKDHQPR